MPRLTSSLLLLFLATPSLGSQTPSDAVSQALTQGDLYFSKHKYDLAIDAYRKADKLSHHSSATCYLKMASAERKLGDFSSALEDAKRAEKVAGDEKSVAVQAHQIRAALLAQMAGKPTDKKLREAEEELRAGLALDATQSLTHYDLGMVLIKQARDAEGVAELNAFVSSPGADEATVAEARRIIANPIRGREPFAPDFSFETRDNQTISNASLRGKVVLLDFWATWCPPCRASLPTIHNVDKKFAGKQFQLVSISGDDDEDVWRTFTEAQHMTWSEYIDLSDKIQEAFKVDSIPTYVVLDKDGVIRYRQSGFGESTESDIEEAINKALKRASDPALAAAAVEPVSSTRASNASNSKASNPKPTSGEETASDDATAEPLSVIESGTVSGNTYKNEDLQITYEFPQGWTAEKVESLHAANVRKEAAMTAALLQQHPELADSMQRVTIPQFLLYISRNGQGNAERMWVPSLRVSAARTRLDDVNLDIFDRLTKNMALAQSIKLIASASKFTVKDHDFVRADFERSAGASKVYYSYVQTISGDYMLTIEIFAASQEDLQKIAASLQSMVITDN